MDCIRSNVEFVVPAVLCMDSPATSVSTPAVASSASAHAVVVAISVSAPAVVLASSGSAHAVAVASSVSTHAVIAIDHVMYCQNPLHYMRLSQQRKT